ncbi:MAG: alpha/beta hydrolase [Gammaproteobacteria bacterium CG11_big_fil_rev_8_21_14_0_20_46_22]|nr:MAG: alpha/beta hydrolase [Gammaproteobacteria bacterium CG12_big_fil_rev_8_21_14_0_65_46_12]PIR11063.1 MAG: alpha/beta hydrolase [Gammaproteobacteria bacterium CG11_big_fil_rev_8_21_14_0_20_46_22]
MPSLQSNGINLYYETYGQGEPLVLVAGFTADHTAWYTVTEALSKHYQVIIFDNRGAGQSDIPKGPYSIDQMADDVISLCDALDIQQAHFIGSSMGGFIVQTLAHRYAERVKSVVICNSVAKPESCYNIFAEAQLQLMKAGAPAKAIIQIGLSWAFSQQFLSHNNMLDTLIELNLNNPYPFSIEGFEAQFAALQGFDSTPWLSSLKLPVLVTGSDEDIVFLEPSMKHIADTVKDAEYYRFERCGHLPYIEYPEAFVSRVLLFLQQS